MFRHRLQLRRWAARMLLLWLFGVGAAVANGCLASGPAGPADPAAEAAAHAHHHHGAQPAHSADEALDHHGGAAKTNCQDFCDKAHVSIPPLKSALDEVQVHALMLTTVAIVLPAPALAPVLAWVPRRDGVRLPPMPIAFGRLAL
jgi:hypothetical protein